jgi:hypothetical protein
MNKTLHIISLIVILTLTGCQDTPMMANSKAYETRLDINAEINAMHLPSGTLIPDTLPTTIQDPVLLAGWISLYNQTKTCALWDGYTLSGQQLAQYILDQAIVIAWNTDPAFSQSSWVDRGETGNIYINPVLKEENEAQMVQLVGTLAHEIFHSTTPFAQVAPTLYEEYWAFYAGSCVSGWAQADFNSFNPLSPSSLKNWFEYNNRSNYLDEYDMYPENMVALSSK